MDDQLEILVQARLNEAVSFATINEQLQTIARNLEPLNVTLNVTTAIAEIRNVTTQIQEMQRNVAGGGQLRIFDAAELQQSATQVFATIEEARTMFEQLGQVKITENLDPLTNQIRNFTLQLTQADGVVTRFRYDLAELNNGATAFVPIRTSVIDNTAALAEKNLQQTQKINRQVEAEAQANATKLEQIRQSLIDKLNGMKQVGVLPDGQISNLESMTVNSFSLETIRAAETEYTRLLAQQNEILAVEKAKYDIQKQQELQIQKNTAALEKMQTLYNSKSASMLSSSSPFSEYVDKTALQNIGTDLAALNLSDPKFTQGLANIRQRLSDVEVGARAAKTEAVGLSQAFENSALKSMALWTAGMDAIEKIREGLQSVV